MIKRAERCLEAGADIIMIDSHGITENVSNWRTDLVAQIIEHLGIEKIMFEANDPRVFEWFIKNYGPKVSVLSASLHILISFRLEYKTFYLDISIRRSFLYLLHTSMEGLTPSEDMVDFCQSMGTGIVHVVHDKRNKGHKYQNVNHVCKTG